MRKTFSVIFTGFVLFFSSISVALAQAGSVGGNPSNPGSAGGNPSNPGSLGGNPGSSLSLQNPLASDDIFELLSQLLDVLMVFAVPLIVFMIIYAGFLYVTARGNPGQISNAHKALTYAVVGGVLILGAWVILEVIQGTVDAFR